MGEAVENIVYKLTQIKTQFTTKQNLQPKSIIQLFEKICATILVNLWIKNIYPVELRSEYSIRDEQQISSKAETWQRK